MSRDAAAIKTQIMQTLAATHASPGSEQGQKIARATTLHHEGIAAIAAYAGGFQVIAWACVAATVALALISLRTKKDAR